MEPFTTFAAIGVPIDIANCDTDQIIPARFLRRPQDDPDYASFLFRDLRFNADGTEKDFVFNESAFRLGKIFVADINWGCGSSRESAVYALAANGVRSVIAPSFGDIHYNNCIKNGVLPVRLPVATCNNLRTQLRQHPGAEVAIDLETQSVTGPDQARYNFDIAPDDKHRLLHGLDDIAVTLAYQKDIEAFETKHVKENPWAF